MSQNHLSGFLNDLKNTNPKFRQSTSSLKGLITHLEQNVMAPRPLTVDQARAFCARGGRDPRLDKYALSLDRLTTVWGKGAHKPYPMLRLGSRLEQVDINRICFRGDDRPPTQIFGAGFSKRTKGMQAKYRGHVMKNTSFSGKADPVRDPMKGFSRAGDLDPDSAVCITPDMHVAALFPLPTNAQRMAKASWVYLVHVGAGFNTYGRQVLDALEGLSQLTDLEKTEAPGAIAKPVLHKVRVDDIAQNLYGREMATNSIASTAIWGAFKITRTWTTTKFSNEYDAAGVRKSVATGADYKDGGSYKISEWVPNPAARYPSDSYKAAVATFVSKMKADFGAKTFRLPTTQDGFAPSLKK